MGENRRRSTRFLVENAGTRDALKENDYERTGTDRTLENENEPRNDSWNIEQLGKVFISRLKETKVVSRNRRTVGRHFRRMIRVGSSFSWQVRS